MKNTYQVSGGIATKVSTRPLTHATVAWDVNMVPCVLAWHASKSAAERFASPNRSCRWFKAVAVLPVTIVTKEQA